MHVRLFITTSLLFAAAHPYTHASELRGQALAGVQTVTMEQMWVAAPQPEYPAEALKRHISGTGVFNLKIQPTTYKVTQVTVVRSTGHKILDDAATKALSRWRGRPGELMSQIDHVHVPVTFR
jgi:TonB family protein